MTKRALLWLAGATVVTIMLSACGGASSASTQDTEAAQNPAMAEKVGTVSDEAMSDQATTEGVGALLGLNFSPAG